jgi:hypothetical protein
LTPRIFNDGASLSNCIWAAATPRSEARSEAARMFEF